MKRKLIQTMTLCAACLAWAAQGQNNTSPGSPSDTTQGSTGQSDTSTSSQSDSARWHGRLSATGRTSHNEVRGSKLMGADVKTTSGESLGKIEDVVVNPTSGRIDFAVISYSGGNESGTSSTTSATTTTTSTTGEKLVPLPWSMIRASGASGYGATTGSAEQPSFVFNGDKSKLQSAPSFDRGSWPDFSQGDWHQRIYSSFGSSATGGASSPGGVSTGESGISTSGDTSSGTSTQPPTTPDSNSSTPK